MGIFDVGRLRREIDLSNKFCAKVQKDFADKSKIRQHDFEVIRGDYSQIVEFVEEQLATFESLERIYFEVKASENFSANKNARRARERRFLG
ncbi:MAG: hypothetical protein IKN16_04055 [Selenomonadaceae bacterium]|nr:hypothetical protein [Selenomonadaceae bacterium]